MRSPRQYFSRNFTERITWKDLPMEKDAVGMSTPAGIFYFIMRLICPLAYVYIALILLREITDALPFMDKFISNYLPTAYLVIINMQKSSKAVEVWVVIEAIFFLLQQFHIRYLQYKNPLEASLSAAPISSISSREELWNQMMENIMSGEGPIAFIRGWFFDEKFEDITRYDICDWITWSMFEGRKQEHLVEEEIRQLQRYLQQLEWSISVHLFGIEDEQIEISEHSSRENSVAVHNVTPCLGIRKRISKSISISDFTENRINGLFESNYHSDSSSECCDTSNKSDATQVKLIWNSDPLKRSEPKQDFHFDETTHDQTPGFFTTLYENYKDNHEEHRHRIEQFENMHPVQDFRNFVANRAHRLNEAEEHARIVASKAYFTLVDRGSSFDKRLHAMSEVMQNQLTDGWNSVWKMKEKLETANVVTSRKKALQQQLKGYKMLLERTVYSNGDSVPTKQMVALMQKITQSNEALEAIEHSASNAFLKAVGLDANHLMQRKAPQRYAKYNEDPILGLATYPLIFNIAILGITDGLLRRMMKKRGFQRHFIGSTVYYYHSGTAELEEEMEEDGPLTPIVFCHGIGIGLIYYLNLIDELLKLGHPLFIPEIPNVCAFRPWQFRKSILTPHGVVSTLTAMLATHGSMKATFVGHSYGTSWLSYMCKYAKEAIAALVFLDPICFCLFYPCLTKSFVYHRPDPGSISYIIKTDVLVNWTIQRSFPWQRINLFVEDIPKGVPCSVYISENDVLIPVTTVLDYFKFKRAHFADLQDATFEHLSRGPVNVTVMRDQVHGDWCSCVDACMTIADSVRILTEQSEFGTGNL